MSDLGIRKKNATESFSNKTPDCLISNEEEGRLRILFDSCDSNNDGKLDKRDLIRMCQRLNMQDFSEDIVVTLGANIKGSEITFDEFLRCRSRILNQNSGVSGSPEYLVHSPYYSHPSQEVYSRGSCSDLSAVYSNADCDSGTQENGEEPLSLHQMLEQCQPELYYKWCAMEREKFGSNTSPSQQILNIANQIHLSRVKRLYSELKNSVKRIANSHTSRDLCQKEVVRLQRERERMKVDLQSQTARYEDRLTELHGVIAELHKKLDCGRRHVILEEEEDEESAPAPGAADKGDQLSQDDAAGRRSRRGNAVRCGEGDTEDYEKLDLAGNTGGARELLRRGLEHFTGHNLASLGGQLPTTGSVANSMETSAMWSRREDGCYVSTSDTGHETSHKVHPPTNQPDYQMAAVQKDDSYSDMMQAATGQQLRSMHNNNLYIQEKLSGYESVVCSLRNQLASVLDEKESLRKQLRDYQDSVPLPPPEMPHHHQQQFPPSAHHHLQQGYYSHSSTTGPSSCGGGGSVYPVSQTQQQSTISSNNSKISLDSKSTNSSSSSPARPIMGVRQQQSKQIQQKSQSSGGEPEWVTKVVLKYQHSCYLASSPSNSHCCEDGGNGSGDGAILAGGEVFLQQLAENVPYPALLEPVHRILLQWHKFVAAYDRDSADKTLLQATLAESKAVSDQLQCWLAQLQSDVAALTRANNLADQQLDMMDVLAQLSETHWSGSRQTMMAPGIGSEGRVRQSYRDQVETAARLLLCRLEASCGGSQGGSDGRQTPDSGAGVSSSTMSSGSVDTTTEQATTTASSSSTGSGRGWTAVEDARLRRALDCVAKERAKVRQAVVTPGCEQMSLPRTEKGGVVRNANLSRMSNCDISSVDSLHNNVESCILAQEVCGLKEERVTLETRIYLLEKEIRSLQLSLESQRSVEAAVRAQLGPVAQGSLSEALERLRAEAANQQRQSEALIVDLNRANMALVGAFERARHKYHVRVGRLEAQNMQASAAAGNNQPAEETAL